MGALRQPGSLYIPLLHWLLNVSYEVIFKSFEDYVYFTSIAGLGGPSLPEGTSHYIAA